MLENGVITQPHFVKIDTEGAELKILNGMKSAAKKIKHIVVEIHKPALGLEGIQNPEEEVELRLKELGFTKLEYLSDIHVMASK